MSVAELCDKFNKWNPIANDYKNTKYNHNISGPGPELDEDLQSSQQAIENKENAETRFNLSLLFKNLPEDMTTKKGMHNICSQHHCVKEVRDNTKKDNYFKTTVEHEMEIRELLRNKRRLRRIWQRKRSPLDKINFRQAEKKLSQRVAEIRNEELSNC